MLKVKLGNIWPTCMGLGILGRMIFCLYVYDNCTYNKYSSFTVM